MERKLIAEWLGTFSLLATVVGSGIMAERLAGGNVAIALLGNTIPTGAILVVLVGGAVFTSISAQKDEPRYSDRHSSLPVEEMNFRDEEEEADPDDPEDSDSPSE